MRQPKVKRPRRKKTAKALQSYARQDEALKLRASGRTYPEIAQMLGYCNKGTAYNAVSAALNAHASEDRERLRQIEGARLDRYLVGMEKRIDLGDPEAVGAAVRISTRRASMLGLDAPKQMEHSGDVNLHVGATLEQALPAAIAAIEALGGKVTPPKDGWPASFPTPEKEPDA